jgi:hypothetical protein
MSPALPLSQPRTLVFLAYPQMGLLDLAGGQTVFWAATKAMAERGLPGYVMHTASLAGGLTPALPAPASPLLAAPVNPERPPKLFRRAFFCCTHP